MIYPHYYKYFDEEKNGYVLFALLERWDHDPNLDGLHIATKEQYELHTSWRKKSEDEWTEKERKRKELEPLTDLIKELVNKELAQRNRESSKDYYSFPVPMFIPI